METQIVNTLSIAIVCYHTSIEDLSALLESILISLQPLSELDTKSATTIYLIDNSEETNVGLEDFKQLKNQFDIHRIELRLIHGQGNIGYGSAHNLALEKSSAQFHLLLNPDVVLDKDCLKIGVSYLLENSKVVIVSPSAVDENSAKQYLCKRYPSVLTFIIRGFFPGVLKKLFRKRLEKFEMHELSEDKPGIDIPIVSGCFMLCRTSALKDLNGFDEKYFLYFEDFDLSLRAARVGRIDYLPAMRIVHGGGNAAKKGISHLTMFAQSGIRFFNSHGWRFFTQ
ncbi:MAG: glycosyltransferase [Pseudomonadales bacterium]|nr:glycosyltransferase [Pseudomonadales bacterium]